MKVRTSIIGDLGSLDAPPGSAPWARAVCGEIQTAIRDYRYDARNLRSWLAIFQKHKGWRYLTDKGGERFLSYEMFCIAPEPFGLGIDSRMIDAIIDERQEKQSGQSMAADSEVEESPPHGCRVSNGNSAPNCMGGNRAKAIVRRLKRDAPEINAALARGEYPSARAAGIAAGIIKPEFNVPADPEACARRLRRHFTGPALARLILALQGGADDP